LEGNVDIPAPPPFSAILSSIACCLGSHFLTECNYDYGLVPITLDRRFMHNSF